MEVKINREIRNYKETVFWGMTLSQFVFAFLACVSAVGGYFLFRPYLGTEILSWVCILLAIPFVALGFIRIHDMSLWKFLSVWLDFTVFIPKYFEAHPSEIINKDLENRRL